MTVAKGLAEIKFAAPVIRPATVSKAEMIARLSTVAVPLVSAVAPAGYGKTTLLARWAEADSRPFAWVALDRGYNDAVVLLRHVAAAIHRVEPQSPELLQALSRLGGSLLAERVPRVGNALATLEKPLVLALDDLDVLANPSCLDVLAALVEYVPDGSLIAVASREEPALPLARWRAQGRVHEIGVADLRLNEREAKQLLEAAGLELDDDEVSELTERTEGWPAGLYLAAQSMQAGAASVADVERFAGDDRFVAEYFRLELLSRLPKDQAQFLRHTSVLDRMSGGLCDAVLQTTGTGQILEALAHTNGFVVPLDRRGKWYRYHHLFGELLRTELERSEPDAVPELNRLAMAWCIANDLNEAAVVYAHAAHETHAVAGLVDALGLHLYRDGRIGTVEEWLGWFDDDDLKRYPALAVLGAWIRVLTGRTEEAERWLELADGATSAIPLSDGSATIEPWVAMSRAGMMSKGVEQALGDADLALDQLSPDSNWRPFAHLWRGVALDLRGATDSAIADFSAAIEIASADEAQAVYLANSKLSLMAAKEGAWGEAGQRASAALALVEETGLGDYVTSALAYVATVRVLLHEGRHEDARAALARAHRLRPMLDHGIPWLTIEVGLELTRAHLALGEADAARTVLTETEAVLELRPDMGVLVDDARELHERVAATSGPAGAWAMSLTRAELRLLPYLATHLTISEIAERLFVSRNTVKKESAAVYRKLGASTRSQAIERAVEVGLLESNVVPPRANLSPEL